MLKRYYSKSKPSVISVFCISVFLLAQGLGASVFGPQTEIAIGTYPHCAVDAQGNLHVVYKYGTVNYVKIDPAGSVTPMERIPGSTNGNRPWICITRDGVIHVVWDTFSKTYYNYKSNGAWHNTIILPQLKEQRNWMPQVSGGYQNEVYVSTWNATKPDNNQSFYKITNGTDGSSKVDYLIADKDGINRAPSVLGPTVGAPGNGQVYAIIGNSTTFYKIINANGGLSGKNTFCAAPSGKTAEGRQGFFIGTEPAVTVGYNYGMRGIAVNTLSRAKSGQSGISLANGLFEGFLKFPRAAYDPVNKKVYVLYPDNEKRPFVVAWDPFANKVQALGRASESQLTFGDGYGTRGAGAGGIAPNSRGGVHVVYSAGNKIFHRIVDGSSVDIHTKMSKLPNQMIELAAFPNPFKNRLSLSVLKSDGSSLAIFNAKGKLVKRFESPIRTGHMLYWDATHQSAGVYVVQCRTKNGIASKKISIIK
jgi:hypothetical protein